MRMLIFFWCLLLAMLPALGQTPRAAEVFSYQVRPGDSWQSLQQRFLKPHYTWQDLRDFNRLPAGFPLLAHQWIFLPQAWLKLKAVSLQVVHVQGLNYWQKNLETTQEVLLSEQMLNKGDRIFAGAHASVSIGFPDGSVLLLKGPGELLIENVRQQLGSGALEVELRLIRGEIESQIQSQSRIRSKVKIITLQGEALINGTRFILLIDGEQTQLEVEQGQVTLSNAQGQVQVAQGFGSQMTANQPPALPQALPPAPKLDQLPKLIEKLPFSATFPAVAEAVGYEISIAEDSAFQKLHLHQESAFPEVAIAQLADGRYWLRVKSVHASGFRSIGSLKRFTIKAQSPAPILQLPKDGDIVRQGPIFFSWESQASLFLLEVLSENKPLAAKRHYLSEKNIFLKLTLADQYFWRVIPMNEQQFPGESSDWYSFQYLSDKP